MQEKSDKTKWISIFIMCDILKITEEFLLIRQWYLPIKINTGRLKNIKKTYRKFVENKEVYQERCVQHS